MPPAKIIRSVKIPAKKGKLESVRGERERQRRLLVERAIVASLLFFCFALVLAVWYTDRKVLDWPIRFFAGFAPSALQSSRDLGINCRMPKNRNTPYCQEHFAEVEESWQSMSRTQGGKVNAFTLHNN